MYAIIETGARQYWVEPGETLKVEKITAKQGEDVVFKALWSADGSKERTVSADKMPSAKVTAQVLRHLRGPKILVFKRRPKKAYEKTQGHRQELTEIQIKEIQLA
ncbi:MAG: 50S ribosomal protein L21 [Elusimicrobia bacterium]|nr:50S ribosomal protein L21 [Elusimicrobiota bacterium]